MALRTIVYIDGFNFYYGQMKGTPFKWLDPEALFKSILGPQNDLIKIKYFTAKVQATPKDPDIHIRQNAYLSAVQAHCPMVEFHFGHFLRHRIRIENANPPPATVEVFKTEEKGSDVNLALHVLHDAWLDAYDCAVIVSNDSDLAEALRLVKEKHRKVIGLVTPGAPTRKTSYQLHQHADFVKSIRTWQLQNSQLPSPVGAIHKPAAW